MSRPPPRLRLNPLHRKLWRDLVDNAGAALTIAAVIGLGITALVGFLGCHRDMAQSRDRYYQDQAFADLRAVIRSAPRSALEDLRPLPGVEAVEGRLLSWKPLELEGVDRRLSCRLISLPDHGLPQLNRPRLLQGRWPRLGGPPEVVLGDRFATVRGVRVGDRVRVLAEEVLHEATVVGLAMSPEFVFVIPAGGGVVPDPRNNALVWGRRRWVEEVLDEEGAINNVIARVGEGADPAVVARDVERALARHGVLFADGREQQPSHSILRDEIENLKNHARVLPSIFLAASVLVLNLVVSRLVASQRAQIGTLVALGLDRGMLVRHYLGFALAIATLGATLGALGGRLLAGGLMLLLEGLFHLPLLAPRLHLDLVAMGFVVAWAAAVLAAGRAVQGALRTSPAEAMRPAPPEARAAALVPHLRGLPLLWRIGLRNLVRHPLRAGVSCLGVALGASVMINSHFFTAAMSKLADHRFRVVERQDMTLFLAQGTHQAARDDAARLPGVVGAELGYTDFFVVEQGRVQRRIILVGVTDDGELLRPRDDHGEAVPVPAQGLMISQKLASILGVRAGETVRLRETRGRLRTHEVPVAALYPSYMGIEAYADLEWLRRLAGEPLAVSGLRLRAPTTDEAIDRQLAESPAVQQVSRRADKIGAWEDSMEGTMRVTSLVLVVCAGALAFGLNLNGALVTLGERRRELGSLRVMGFRRAEVADLVMHEHVLVAAFGLLAGVPLGYAFTSWAHRTFNTELYRLPWLFSRPMIAEAVLLSILFAALAHLASRRWLARRDWRGDLGVKE